MPIVRLDSFREDVRQFLKNGAEIQTKISMDYVMNRAPEIATIWPKVVEYNEKFFKGEVTLDDVWTIITREEMLSLTGMLRHMVEQLATVRMKRSPIPQGVGIESADVDGVPGEWQIVPGASEDRVILYFHGGGFIFGSAYIERPLTVALGKAAEMKVLSINYRLAPEDPFPAALDDCTKAYQWLLRMGIKPSNIVIAGDSAGGNLTLATILNLRDKGVPLPRGGVCFSPGTNVGGTDLSKGQTDPMLGDMGIFWWRAAYVGIESPEEIRNPLVSPLLADLGGLPPLLLQATPPELLFDNAKQFVEKVKTAGGDATFQTWDGMVHVWQLFFLGVFPEAQDAIDKAGEWVKKLYV
jgi:epsilon-lactone hydrolase